MNGNDKNDPGFLTDRFDLLYTNSLRAFWQSIPSGSSFPLADGGTCVVLYPGVPASGAGPDFRNARLRTAGREIEGGVLIRRRASDWIAEGRPSGPDWRNLVLFAVDCDDRNAANRPYLPGIPVLVLPRPGTDSSVPSGRGHCSALFRRMDDTTLRNFAAAAGIARLRAKSDRMLYGMIHSGARSIFFLRFMELLGVSGNRAQFRMLGTRLLRYGDRVFADHFKALLWGESGLLPDPAAPDGFPDGARDEIRTLWEEYWPLRSGAHEPPAFRRGVRPLNSVERRLALAVLWMEKLLPDPLGTLSRLWAEASGNGDFLDRLHSLLPGSDPFWNRRISFDAEVLPRPAALAGPDRYREMATDLFLPAMHAFARMEKKESVLPELEKLYMTLSKNAENRIFRAVVSCCFPGRASVFGSAAAQQGLIHIHRTYCAALSLQCGKCPFAASGETGK